MSLIQIDYTKKNHNKNIKIHIDAFFNIHDSFFFFFYFNVGVRTSLRVPRLIPRALKLTTM